ncbi:type IV secretion system protein B10, putative [Sulfitobacter sp. NAS-14.1]|uniref:TrbI/VirB10 family protein n=1 Tax=unclassified Sulfitobacter TaxID=196795 RepID=UPI000066D373|nr:MULTISPECIES: TrbI/VirB10 family protein [unclassified Sulfitobacter]AXI52937.1 type IV secretion system protein B10 [Sulfitobacter sp. SK025]EAP78795.1 type IV secretion system protein B10, putative [Sulfitobacter sp. NAS-14.1]HCT33251.1 type IV secretion system protein B10 [Sulfitobacter sp.]|tara:strand:+ start:54 stop:1481 length:1428 start_codon:yes stop_codon:yes gene_type:complete
MADENTPDLQDRLSTFSQKGKAKRRGGNIGVGALAIALALGGGGAAYFLATNLQEGSDGLETSDVETFQDQRTGNGGRLEFPPDEAEQRVNDALIAVEEALDVPAPAPAAEPSAAVLEEIAKLREALAASQSARNAEIQEAVSDLREAFQVQTDALEASIAAKDTELQNAQRQNEARLAGLQAMLDAERAQREGLESEMAREGLIADQRLLEERQRQEDEQRQREAERVAQELLTAQIVSPSVVYADGPRAASAGTTNPTATTGADGPTLSENEQYLRQGARPLDVQEASQMAFPERTLSQGSVIQAALQTAINSDLPGSVVAVVSEPVPAFSGDQILIPRGSRLFGQYRSGIELNQKRILILWTRVLTPDGTSIEIASVGGDQLGRSGLTGIVDTKFAERFGGAALISLIGAAPAVAANSADNETASEVLQGVSEDLEDAVGSVIAEQVSISPTIYIDQGASVTVLVDRDVVIY